MTNKIDEQKLVDTSVNNQKENDIKQSCHTNDACIKNAGSMYSVRYIKNKNNRYHRFQVPFSDFNNDEIEVKTCKCRVMISGRRERATCGARSVNYLFKVINLPGTYMNDFEINTQVMITKDQTSIILWVPVKTF